MKQSIILKFEIENIVDLVSGKSSYSLFTHKGGSLGSENNNFWSIQDLKQSVAANVARIEWRDNAYCLKVLTHSLIINNATFREHSGLIRLQTGDSIICGNLNIAVTIAPSGSFLLDNNKKSVEEIITESENNLDHFLERTNKKERTKTLNLAETVDDKLTYDPLEALAMRDRSLSTIQELKSDSTTFNELINQEVSSNIYYNNGDMEMNQSFIDLPISDQNIIKRDDFKEKAYVGISPLMRGMETEIPLSDSQVMNDFLEDIGATLKAAIEGLLALQKENNGLIDKHLRPIEDNPLRLDMDYKETIDVLFGDRKSPVHLAAPSAVSESLENLLTHNQANKMAISQALQAILQAFSPDLLLRRFSNYSRSNKHMDGDNSWAWDMYQKYYIELTSERQQGFEKLFWEVYTQAYDKSLREQVDNQYEKSK